MRRNPDNLSSTSALSVCEDHFNVSNNIYLVLMGSLIFFLVGAGYGKLYEMEADGDAKENERWCSAPYIRLPAR